MVIQFWEGGGQTEACGYYLFHAFWLLGLKPSPDWFYLYLSCRQFWIFCLFACSCFFLCFLPHFCTACFNSPRLLYRTFLKAQFCLKDVFLAQWSAAAVALSGSEVAKLCQENFLNISVAIGVLADTEKQSTVSTFKEFLEQIKGEYAIVP